jgi:membrane associated rhomboid family serine protease
VFLIAVLYKIPIKQVELLISNYLSISADAPKLLDRFWMPLSYMFLHFDFWHIFFNMLWLYWFGRVFLEFLSSKKLLRVYLWGGFSGALFFILAYNMFPVFESIRCTALVGASASVLAIVMAVSFYVPRYTLNFVFLGRIRLIWIAVVYLIIDFIVVSHSIRYEDVGSIGNNSNIGGYIAHLGGALFGFLYAMNLKRNFLKLRPLKRHFRPNYFKKKAQKTTTYRYTNDELYNIQKKQKQEEIDRILDKISKHGYGILSKKEKETLFEKSH